MIYYTNKHIQHFHLNILFRDNLDCDYKRNMLKRIILILLLGLTIISCTPPVSSNIEIDNYIKNNYQTPEEYVISKFSDHDYVFIGEQHRIKHDVNFISNLIPGLYKNGIMNLAIEFGASSNQSLLDSLLSMDQWDQDFAYQIASKGYYISWGYKEYLDILKKAWELNQTLEEGRPKFRIIYLNTDYFPYEKGKAIYGGIEPDLNMSNTLQKEVIGKNEKALIYTGINHAFTRFNQIMYDSENTETFKLYDERFGNLIHKIYPERTFTIFLHAPWASKKRESSKAVKPAKGVIDACMASFNNKPVGFNVTGTPFGALSSNDSFYCIGHDHFTLADFCDGYIFLKPYSQFEKVSVADGFYTGNRLNEIRDFYKGLGLSAKKVDNWSQEAIEYAISKDGDFVLKTANRLK